MRNIYVAIIDNYPLYSEAIASLLDKQPGISISVAAYKQEDFF